MKKKVRLNSKKAGSRGHSGFAPSNQRRHRQSYFERPGLSPDAQTLAHPEPARDQRLDTILMTSADRYDHKFVVTSSAVGPSSSPGETIEIAVHTDPDRCTRQALEIFIKEEIKRKHGDEVAKRFERIELIIYLGEVPLEAPGGSDDT